MEIRKSVSKSTSFVLKVCLTVSPALSEYGGGGGGGGGCDHGSGGAGCGGGGKDSAA